MAADWWARGIAISAAVATALNMGIAAMTYRRLRPQVQANAVWGLLGEVEDAKKGNVIFGFRLHVRNLSPTSAKVESVHVVSWMPLRHPLKKLIRKPWLKRLVPVYQEITVPRVKTARASKAPDMELPAFGGLLWDIPYDFDSISPIPGWASVTVVVRLTNGEEVRGKRVSRTALVDQVGRLNGYFPELNLSSPTV